MSLELKVKEAVKSAFQKLFDHELDDSQLTLLPTRKEFEGEYTFVTFPLARFSKKNSLAITQMLETVVDDHVPKAKVDGYRVGGKTGTSFKAVAGGYGNDYVGLFAGVAPISDPKVVVVVVINDPGGDLYHGGDVAAPVFSRVMKGALRVLNVAPDTSNKLAAIKKEASDA